jgi:hypothetical protein
MATIKNALPDLFTPLFDKMYLQAYEETEAVFDKLFEIIPDNSHKWESSGISTLGAYQAVEEAQEIPLDQPRAGYNVELVPVKYGKAVQLSYEFVDDIEARYTDIQSAVTAVVNAKRGEILDMGRRARYKMDDMCAEIFRNSSTSGNYSWGTSTLGGDGMTLVDAAHPYNPDDATTLSNEITTAFSEAALEELLLLIDDNALDPRGEIIDINPTVLLYPPELEYNVQRLLTSRGRIGTGNNDINIHANTLTPIKWRRLTDATDYFLVVPKMGLKMIMRKEPSFRFVDDPKNETYNFYSSFRAVPGYDDWRGVWGATV